MELWISHLFPELTPKEVSLLSLILHGKTIKLRTEEFEIAFSAYDKVRSNNGDSKFGEDRETMFSILDRHTQALKKAFYKHISYYLKRSFLAQFYKKRCETSQRFLFRVTYQK